ncbi:IS5 family transposase [Streptomyces anthocyanicus]|uniref:IS5 family transposase n=2 Tax=Streptomyces anthocyanicus TaxID=68174 RepID=UPI0036550F50
MRISACCPVSLVMGNRQSRPRVVSDELWSLVEPLLPKPGPKKAEGRPRVPDRQALSGILFVLHTGIQWECLPQELGFGSGTTCWGRLAAWNEAGVWDQLHVLLPEKLRSKNWLDWERAVIDSSHVRAARRGPKAVPARSTAHGRAASTVPSSTDRASRSRCRRPAATAGDVTQLQPLVGKIPAVAGQVGRPRRRPGALLADRGYDPRQIPPPALATRHPPRDREAGRAARHRPGHLPLRR